MPYKEKQNFKLYYSIGEVAELLDVNTSLLRFWEKEFPDIKPQKNSRGNRIYKDKDVNQLRMIHHLVKERGFTLEGAKQKMKQSKSSLEDEYEVIESLKHVKSLLLDLKESL